MGGESESCSPSRSAATLPSSRTWSTPSLYIYISTPQAAAMPDIDAALTEPQTARAQAGG
jgi:hypothetical protein